MLETQFDIAVVGGGLVGASLVLAFATFAGKKKLRVLHLEANLAASPTIASDERHLAINAFSWQTLKSLGVVLDVNRCAPIQRIHISSRGDFGRVLLDATHEGVSEFGRLVPASQLRDALEKALANCSSAWLTRQHGSRLIGLDTATEGAANLTLAASDGALTKVSARLVVGCDGTQSSVREFISKLSPEVGEGNQESNQESNQEGHQHGFFDYQTSALSFNFKPEYDPLSTAYERFTDTGPIALLPLPNRRMGAVWTLPSAQANAALQLSEAEFLQQFQQAFGYRLGRFSALGRRALWPLQRLRARPDFSNRCVLIGNAAQTIHPLGAQGFNLGLRDAIALAATIEKADQNFDELSVLQVFSAARSKDRADTLRFSDSGLVATQNTSSLARVARSMAFTALETAPLAKRSLVRFGLGYVR